MTKGKGPFARRQRASPPDYEAPRFFAPRVDLNEENIRALLHFIRGRNDAGALRLFESLAKLRPRARLARNINSLLSKMIRDPVGDVYRSGFTRTENGVLITLEQWGTPQELMSVAHMLLNAHERQIAVQMGLNDLFDRVDQ